VLAWPAVEQPGDDTLSEEQDNWAGTLGVPAVPYLLIALECSRPLVGSSRHSLARVDEVTFGRGPNREVQRVVREGIRRLEVRVPDPWMSSSHARLKRDGLYWRFEDSESTNGSRVDGNPCRGPLVLDESTIELGRTFFLLRCGLPSPAGTANDFSADVAGENASALATLLPMYAWGLKRLTRVANSTVPVLLLGETGTGKELLAKVIHERSLRPGPFVAVNCGALPESLTEAQLFGHSKGAFSGAVRDEIGYVRSADTGTLFLDEIGDLSPASQAALLRVLQENEVVPVGTTRAIPVDLRVVAATNAPINDLVQKGLFRSDLLGRLAGFTFTLPPLRDRREDLALIACKVLHECTGDVSLSPSAVRALLNHSWPRNIRELRQCLSSAAVLADGELVEPCHLPASIAGTSRECRVGSDAGADRAATGAYWPLPPGVREPEDTRLREELIAQLTAYRGNVTQVARALGKARVQIQRWVKRFELDPRRFR
jgi:DNA-binding NtrC family response regulator